MTYLLGRSKEINTYIAWKKREAARYSLIQRQTLPWKNAAEWEGEPGLISQQWWGYTHKATQTGKGVMI